MHWQTQLILESVAQNAELDAKYVALSAIHQLVEGTPYRDIAGQFGVSKAALERHRSAHLTELLEAQELKLAEHGRSLRDNLEERVSELHEQTRQIMESFANSSEIDAKYVALSAIHRCEKQIELMARLTGRFQRDRENEVECQAWTHAAQPDKPN